MKILVTGATGFIGQNLVSFLIKKNIQVFCLVRERSDILKIDKNANIIKSSLSVNNIIELFLKEKFDGVIHLASLFLVEHKAEDIDNLIFSNIHFGTKLLEASKISKVKWFINTGTLWQNFDNEDYNPVNLYAATKEAFENIAKYYTETSDLNFCTIKLNDTFGANDTRNKIFSMWMKFSQTKDLLQMSPGEQVIDISYIEDIIEAYYILVKHLSSENSKSFKNKTFAVSAEEKMSLKKLSKIFEEATNTRLNIIWGGREYRSREVMMPSSRYESVPGWKPKYSLEEAIKKMIGKI
jgi:nucleoside-diphosphate-sugar epimerase